MARPLEDSKRGDNTLTLSCDVFGGKRHYAVCLHVMDRCKNGKTEKGDGPCAKAIAQAHCPARKMRLEEQKAGESLYFTPREENPLWKDTKTKYKLDVHNPSFQRGWNAAGRMLGKSQVLAEMDEGRSAATKPVRRKTTVYRTTEPSVPATTGNLYADLVNKLMAEKGKGGA